ncbi:MAG TPA: hypothetical protein DCL43_05610 [Chitinophagaceae bacterium]|nr:hypothetical protein [Chitinophagaceae bacterium]HAN39610.1 hypothetical protein [Chitinophagaceae bacterium]
MKFNFEETNFFSNFMPIFLVFKKLFMHSSIVSVNNSTNSIAAQQYLVSAQLTDGTLLTLAGFSAASHAEALLVKLLYNISRQQASTLSQWLVHIHCTLQQGVLPIQSMQALHFIPAEKMYDIPAAICLHQTQPTAQLITKITLQ